MKFCKRLGALAIASGLLVVPNVFAQSAQSPSNLSPNTLATATYFSDVCTPFLNLGINNRRTIQAVTQATTRQGTDALSVACSNFFFGELDQQTQQGFIENLDPVGFISFKIDTLLFAQSGNEAVMDRLQSLRRKSNTNAYNEKATLGGGASADDSTELLNKKLGLWFRVNDGSGAKERTLLTDKLDSNQFSGSVGMDYRVTDNTIIGGVVGYRHSSTKFGESGDAGKMDAGTINVAAYFSSYVYKNLYVDSLINYGSNKFDTRRNVHDVPPSTILYTPDGHTNGDTLSGSIALGYEFAVNGWTLTPSLNYSYVDSKIDAFAEGGQGPFDLSYDKQHYTSSSARLDLNISYAATTATAVWLPHLRVEAIKEFRANIDTFDVRFVNDASSMPAPLPVQMDKLDDQYLRVDIGLSAQFHNDVSAYLDYQQLLGFESVSLKSVVAGLRLQF